MDTTEQYIKMCEKAVEIQGGWQPHWGDYICDEPHASLRVAINTGEWSRCGHDIWLPLQHQLQEIVFELGEGTIAKVVLLVEFIKAKSLYCTNFRSMEQLWLAFVMHEKYNKVWNGEDWIEEG